MLPPCLSVLIQDVQRVNYQSRIWHQCLVPSPSIGNPVGWCINSDKHDVLWMKCNPAPGEVSPNKVDEIVQQAALASENINSNSRLQTLSMQEFND